MSIDPKDLKVTNNQQQRIVKPLKEQIDMTQLNDQIDSILKAKKKDEVFKDITYQEASFLKEQKQIDAVCTTTTGSQQEMWFENFSMALNLFRRINLPDIEKTISCPHCNKQFSNPQFDACSPFGRDIKYAKIDASKSTTATIIVGAAPPLKDEHIQQLKKFKGTIICANKILRRLLKHDIIPDWVTCLDGTSIVYESFDDDLVRKYAHKINAFCCTAVNYKVAQFMRNFKEVYWTNAWIGEADPTAYTESCIMQTISGIGQSRTGGNAGTLGVLLGHHLGCNPIGMLGMDFSRTPDTTWLGDKEKIRAHEYFYNPDIDDTFGICPAFKAYLHWLLNYSQSILYNKDGVVLYNLSDWGMLQFTQLHFLKNMDLDVYIEHYNKKRKFILTKHEDMTNIKTKELENVLVATNGLMVKREMKNKDGTTRLNSNGEPFNRDVYTTTV